MEAVAAAGRFAQFLAAAILFGWPLFQLYAGRRSAARPTITAAALLGLVGGLAALAAESVVMTGAAESALRPSDWWAVLTSTTYGHGMAVRLALLAVAAAVAVRSTSLWPSLALGAGVCASFAWTGHAAGGEGAVGAVHRAADVIHVLAAEAWLGALAVLSWRVLRSLRTGEDAPSAAGGLARVSGVGGALVAALVLSGLVNSWMLVGVGQLATLPETPYGRLLLTKLGLFAAMICGAGANRYVLAPRLTRRLVEPAAVPSALRALRFSLLLESGLGMAVLIVVSLLGLLAPPGMS